MVPLSPTSIRIWSAARSERTAATRAFRAAPFCDAQAKIAALLRTVSHGAHTRGAWMLLYTNRRRYWLSLEDFQHEIQELTFRTPDREQLRQATDLLNGVRALKLDIRLSTQAGHEVFAAEAQTLESQLLRVIEGLGDGSSAPANPTE